MPPLAPVVSALARQTMRTAFEDLERTITPADSRYFRNTALQQVRLEALKIEDQLAARQSLRNMRRLTPLLNGLEHYARVVEVLCNGTPYLSWIWAPITLILRIASEYIEAFEQLMKGYRRIAESLNRFEILSDTFIANPDFQRTLAVFYADILQFHKHAYKFVRRSGWKLLFLTSWGRFQRRFDNIIDDMTRHGNLIDQEANAHNIAEAHRMRQDVRSWREESLDHVKRDEEEQAATQYASILSWLKTDESEQLSISDSIADESAMFPGTCDWILNNIKIKSWLQRNSEMPFMWLQGSPGSGKSVITNKLVNFILAGQSRVLRHFCTYSYASSIKYEHIIRSILLQLLRMNGEIVAHVYKEYVFAKKQPTIPTLERLLQILLGTMADEPRQTEYIWIIIDGFDECELEKQPRLANLMTQIASKSAFDVGTICKVLFSSRSTPDLCRCLRKAHRFCLNDETESLDRAIMKYVSQRLRLLHARFSQLGMGDQEIEAMARSISQKSAGMFLYARLVLDYLSTNIFYSGREVTSSIDQLPRELADFYLKILTQIIARLDTRSVERVKCILSWVAFAKRPLKKLEFLSAVSFSTADPSIDRLVPDYVLDICSPLIEERRDTKLTFIHVSVREFLKSNQSNIIINEQEAHREHGVASITCLLSGLNLFNEELEEQERLFRLIKGIHGFHVYATEYWVEYLLADASASNGADTSSTLFALATQLAHKLEQSSNHAAASQDGLDLTESDERIKHFSQHELLYKHVQNACRARSQKRLKSELFKEQRELSTSSYMSVALDGVSELLESYQCAVKLLLIKDFFPGVSAEELNFFKSQFRTSAYTCRLRSCPRATIGFDSELLRHDHEMTHAGGFRCTHAGCQYPALKSAQQLKTHVNKYHIQRPARKLITKLTQAHPHGRITGHPGDINARLLKNPYDYSIRAPQDVTRPPTEPHTLSHLQPPKPTPRQIGPIQGFAEIRDWTLRSGVAPERTINDYDIRIQQTQPQLKRVHQRVRRFPNEDLPTPTSSNVEHVQNERTNDNSEQVLWPPPITATVPATTNPEELLPSVFSSRTEIPIPPINSESFWETQRLPSPVTVSQRQSPLITPQVSPINSPLFKFDIGEFFLNHGESDPAYVDFEHIS